MKQYVVDAFTDKVFSGNPAAVCVTDSEISEEIMMNITRENNLSETAFAVKNGDFYKLRWFTPGGEIDLCGHATLGTAHVIMNYYEKDLKEVSFETMSGILTVKRKGELYEMDFPTYDLKPVKITKDIVEALGVVPKEAYMGRDMLCVFDREETVRKINPDLEKLKNIEGLLMHVTARGGEFDCVSRSFAPKLNVAEDPVCGSGHCHIVPYWAEKLNKNTITAYQASERGGILYCHKENGRIKISGKVSLYSIAELYV